MTVCLDRESGCAILKSSPISRIRVSLQITYNMKNLVTPAVSLSDGTDLRPQSPPLFLTRRWKRSTTTTMPVKMSSLSAWTIAVVFSALVISSQMGVEAKITSSSSPPASSSLASKGTSSSLEREISQGGRNSSQNAQSKRPVFVSEVAAPRTGESDQRSISSGGTDRSADSTTTGVTGRLFFFKGMR